MDEQTIINQLNKGITQYTKLPLKWQESRFIVITAIKKDYYNINYLPKKYYNDLEIMLMAVRLNGLILSKVSKNLIQNYYIVLAAVSQNGKALKYVFDHEVDYEDEYDEGYDDGHRYRTFIGRYINDDTRQYLIDKKSIVLRAVQNCGLALEYASTRLKADKEIVSKAIEQNGYALNFASDILQKDQELIFKAIRQNFDMIYNVSLPPSLKKLFKDFYSYSTECQMEYLFENIKKGTLLPHAIVWLSLIPYECHKELVDWINANIYDYKSLFEVVFYKQTKFNHCLGYFEGLPQTILSFLLPSEDTRQKQKVILTDLFMELQYYM